MLNYKQNKGSGWNANQNAYIYDSKTVKHYSYSIAFCLMLVSAEYEVLSQFNAPNLDLTNKLGFTGVYIIFLISAQKHRLWVLVRTALTRQF